MVLLVADEMATVSIKLDKKNQTNLSPLTVDGTTDSASSALPFF